jgi:hypothetical protein
VLVAHTCNPSNSGGRDQEDRGSKPARANSLQDLTLKKRFAKIGLTDVAQEFKPQYWKKKKSLTLIVLEIILFISLLFLQQTFCLKNRAENRIISI